jgi:hypothetical protein
LAKLHSGGLDPLTLAREVSMQNAGDSTVVTAEELRTLLLKAGLSEELADRVFKTLGPATKTPLHRGAVCHAFYSSLKP